MSNEYKDYQQESRQENKRLIEKYPFLMIKDNGVCPWCQQGAYEYTWLDDMPDGWRIGFAEKMCDELLEALGKYADQWIIYQLKEKYGRLVIYHSGIPRDVYDKVDNIIMKYEKISEETCVMCGAPGVMRTGGWILPYCDLCYEKGTKNV